MNNVIILNLRLENNSNRHNWGHSQYLHNASCPFLCSCSSVLHPCSRSNGGSERVRARNSELMLYIKYTDYMLCFIMLRDLINQQLYSTYFCCVLGFTSWLVDI